jgi:hypothetical protein
LKRSAKQTPKQKKESMQGLEIVDRTWDDDEEEPQS